MNRILQTLKVALLLSAIAILAWTAVPGAAQAVPPAEGTDCAGPGETCHAIIHGEIHHFKDLGGATIEVN